MFFLQLFLCIVCSDWIRFTDLFNQECSLFKQINYSFMALLNKWNLCIKTRKSSASENDSLAFKIHFDIMSRILIKTLFSRGYIVCIGGFYAFKWSLTSFK